MMTTITEQCIQLMNRRFGLDISIYNHSFLEKVLLNRMSVFDCDKPENYIVLLEDLAGESNSLLAQLSNSYSEFFRNPLTFALLEQSVLPRLFDRAAKINASEIRIWSAGCASGQEAYSLAILLDDFKDNHKSEINFRILATDSSEKELESARNAVYDLKTLKNIPIGRVENYFSRSGDNFKLDESIRKQVDFSYYDLLNKDSGSPPSGIYGDYDLIMCSNVLFYYEPEYQLIILNKIHRSLKPGGFFVTGEAEIHLVNTFGGFRSFGMTSAIFVRN